MNEEQKLRLDLLGVCGYNIEAARKCRDFVRGDTAKKQESACDRLVDGIYLINKYGGITPYDGKEKIGIEPVAHIGIVQGSHSVAISLHDVSEDEITLTEKQSKKDYGGCKDCFYMDAISDWDGKGNTERLEEIGLYPAIWLKDDEYVPALAELYLICLNRKAINSAMRFVGGQELAGWYWSSTEFSATNAWGLHLNDGYANYWSTKATYTSRVRPVKKFL